MPDIKFGIVTDLHYDPVLFTTRLTKLQDFVEEMNSYEPDFLINCGDLVHLGWDDTNWDTIVGAFTPSTAPVYHVLGNHEYNLYYDEGQAATQKESWKAKTGYDQTYYSFNIKNHHFVVLDTNFNQAGDGFPDHWYDPYIDQAQLAWLATDLRSTALPTYIFAHHRVDRAPDNWTIQNSPQLRRVIESAGKNKVKAVFMGHEHINESRLVNGVWYHEIDDMLTGSYPTTAFAKVEITDTKVTITGAGTQADFSVPAPTRTRIRARNFGSALRFNGTNSVVTAPNPAVLSLTGTEATFSAWIRPLSVSVTNNILCKSNAGITEGYRMRIANTGKATLFAAIAGVQKRVNSTSTLVTHQWQHLVGVITPTQLLCYLNGEQEDEVTAISGALTASGSNFRIGDGAAAGPFKGDIDEVRIWDRALTAAEILALYETDTVPTTGLIGEWKFDEGEGISAADTSANDSTGTISNGVFIDSIVKGTRRTA